MSELDFFFNEQQQIMNMPDEDLTDYLMRRQRRYVPFSWWEL